MHRGWMRTRTTTAAVLSSVLILAHVASAAPPTGLPPNWADLMQRDTDGDGIRDLCDECIAEPEVFNLNEDGDGCPDTFASTWVLREEHRHSLNGRVSFALNSSTVTDADYVLQGIRTALTNNPGMEVIGIVGRATQGETRPLQRSLARANAVRDALIALGLDARRLEARGIGVSTERVVDFTIMHMSGYEFVRWENRHMLNVSPPLRIPVALPLMHRIPVSEEARYTCSMPERI